MEPTIESSLLSHASHLAEGIWSPALIIDKEGKILFFNEGAEVAVGRPFAELGPMPASEWGALFNVRSRDGKRFPLDAMPGWIALQQSRPTTGHVLFTSLDGIDRFMTVVAFPLFTQLGEFEGALVHLWEDEDSPGETLEATLLFCDQRGYTAEASQLEPGLVKELLSVYYEHTARLINRHGGMIVSFTGDEVFATWGVPTSDDAGPERAVACARLLQDSASALNRKLAARDLPAIAFGIGIHTGEVIGAHVGFGALRQYTVTGDSVNCASRLCSIAGRNEIVVSAQTYELLNEKPPAETLAGIRLKGVDRDLLPHRLWPDEYRDPTGESHGKIESEAP